ncbi:hypothetical protein ACLOJK_014553, partial [Asimina triloba]
HCRSTIIRCSIFLQRSYHGRWLPTFIILTDGSGNTHLDRRPNPITSAGEQIGNEMQTGVIGQQTFIFQKPDNGSLFMGDPYQKTHLMCKTNRLGIQKAALQFRNPSRHPHHQATKADL